MGRLDYLDSTCDHYALAATSESAWFTRKPPDANSERANLDKHFSSTMTLLLMADDPCASDQNRYGTIRFVTRSLS
jgi:hypothetical protein